MGTVPHRSKLPAIVVAVMAKACCSGFSCLQLLVDIRFAQPLPPDEILAVEGPVLFRSLLPVEVQVAIASFAEAMVDVVRRCRGGGREGGSVT